MQVREVIACQESANIVLIYYKPLTDGLLEKRILARFIFLAEVLRAHCTERIENIYCVY